MVWSSAGLPAAGPRGAGLFEARHFQRGEEDTTALSIGIGVDYTVHVIHRYREEFDKRRNPEAAAIRTLATTGSGLLGSALTTAPFL